MLMKIQDYIQKKSVYNSILPKSPKYIELATKYAKNLKKNGHVVIIICMNIKQIEAISDSLTAAGVENRKFYGKKREIDKDKDTVIVATYSFCGKGFDMPRLSALILACPLSGKKSVIQVVGRVLRSFVGKLNPVVVDMVDMAFPIMAVPEVKRKKAIISGEFTDCKVIEYDEP